MPARNNKQQCRAHTLPRMRVSNPSRIGIAPEQVTAALAKFLPPQRVAVFSTSRDRHSRLLSSPVNPRLAAPVASIFQTRISGKTFSSLPSIGKAGKRFIEEAQGG